MSPAESLKIAILEKVKEIDQLRAALRIIDPELNRSLTPIIINPVSTPEAQSEPAPSPLKAVAAEQTAAPAPSIPVQTPSKAPVYTGPRCGACNGKMYQTYRTMPSGAVVNLLKCNDSACGNEAYQ